MTHEIFLNAVGTPKYYIFLFSRLSRAKLKGSFTIGESNAIFS